MKEYLYFAATASGRARRLQYRGLRSGTEREVCGPRYSKKDPGRLLYYRHSAMQWQFCFLENKWYLEITPTYHYTRDGLLPELFAEEHLKRIKEKEKNAAVLGQVVMWADLLARRGDLFSGEYPFLQFGSLESLDLDYGINDDQWLSREDEAERVSAQRVFEMKAILLQEPELEFGTGRHVDIRFGLMAHGPVDFENSPASRIRAGIVGSPESIEGAANWIGKCRGEIQAKASNHPYLFPKFPGCNQDTNLKFTVEVGTTSFREILDSQIEPLLKNPSRATAVETVAKLFLAEIEYLASSQKVQVIICAPPMLLFKFLAEESSVGFKEFGAKGDPSEAPDFHDWLKAHAMNAGVPIQVVWPSTDDETKSLPKTRGQKDKRQLQDEATRAWNFHLALYYKAGGVPWRMSRSATDMTTLYVGVSFYRALEKTRLQTSMAQVFNERGEGVIVRGGTAKLCKDDMQVHLDSASANQLMDGALSQYKREHFTMPARIVLHKTSSFDAAEIEGFKSAITKHSIHSADLLYVLHADTRAFRDGVYPPLRGTYINLEDHLHLLYTRGSVEFFNVYPGMYVPHPLRFRSDHLSQSAVFAAQELLALTKMNWNNTQFDGLEPITIRAARQVGSILKYIDDPRLPYQSRYSFYM